MHIESQPAQRPMHCFLHSRTRIWIASGMDTSLHRVISCHQRSSLNCVTKKMTILCNEEAFRRNNTVWNLYFMREHYVAKHAATLDNFSNNTLCSGRTEHQILRVQQSLVFYLELTEGRGINSSGRVTAPRTLITTF